MFIIKKLIIRIAEKIHLFPSGFCQILTERLLMREPLMDIMTSSGQIMPFTLKPTNCWVLMLLQPDNLPLEDV